MMGYLQRTVIICFGVVLTAMVSRDQKVETLAKLLREHVINPQIDKDRTSGSVCPSNSLRHRNTRDLFAWCSKLEGRWFTSSMVTDTLRKVMSTGEIQLPQTPGFSLQTWIAGEASILHKLCVRGRKSVEGKATSAMAANPDELETQAWDLDPAEDFRGVF